jgi:hypothetical protein
MARNHSEQQPQGGVPDGLVVGVLGFLLGITVLSWTATGTAGLLAHGSWPTSLHFTRTPLAIRHLVGSPQDITGAWPASEPATLPRAGLFWGIFIGQLLLLFVLAVFLIGVVARYRIVRAARRARGGAPAPERAPEPGPKPGPKPGPQPEPAQTAAATTLLKAPAMPERPEPLSPPAPQPSPPGTPAPWTAGPDGTYAVFAAHRSDKGERLVQPAVLNAAGPVLVTTADPETFHRTVGNRSKLGPVHVYDPAHLIDIPGRLRWAPHTSCEDAPTATARAAALLHALRPRAASEMAVHDAAQTLLRCWLHASAVDGLPFRQVHRWAGGGGTQEPVRILRTNSAARAGWSGELESVLHAHTERRDAARELIHRALECLGSVHIRDACNPTRSDTLLMESFLSERGSLYVVGEPNEDPRTRPGAMPLMTALVSSVVEHGRRMAERSPSGRLDPPLSIVLDDVAALAPLPGLAELLADGAALGLPTLAVLRSPEQSRDRWPGSPWQQADSRLVLGPTAPALFTEIPDAVRIG